ncbi:MAG: 4-(cytidine 5'-diphospho)-2-C-methyl-D-erythritol kinase, partial [Octadecabacter sp.]|nr:4-(cytidine 5'-diphospho)-2-C-methyl-D-erythritol kinase [Octadecabacter sp.]
MPKKVLHRPLLSRLRPVTNGTIVEYACAKINLSLHVTGLRADGYHLLDSLVMFT